MLYEGELEATLKFKAQAEQEQECTRRHSRKNTDPGREKEELLKQQESIIKEIARSRRKIEFQDEKAKMLRTANEDMRLRAEAVWQGVPDAPNKMQPSIEILKLQETVSEVRTQLHQLKGVEEGLGIDRNQARKALDDAEVEVKILEQKMQLLNCRRRIFVH